MDGSNFVDQIWWDEAASHFAMSQLVEVLPKKTGIVSDAFDDEK